MKISLTGLLQDGSPQRAGALIDARTTVKVTQGVDLTLDLTVQNPSGRPISLIGRTLTLVVKQKPADAALITKTATIVKTVATFTLVPRDTKNLTTGRYVFDVWATTGGKRDPVIPLSGLILEASVAPI